MKRSWLLLSSFVLPFLYYGCAVNPVSGNQDFVLMSENQEIAMGKRYNAEVLKQIPVYSDNELQQYVQALGESLAKNSHRSNLIYRFTVLDQTHSKTNDFQRFESASSWRMVLSI